MAVAHCDVPAHRARRRVAQRRHVVIVAMRIAPDFEVEIQESDAALVGDAEYRDIADLVKPAAHPDRIRRCWVVIAGQYHERQLRVCEKRGGAVDRVRRDLMIVEGVAGKDHGIGAERPRRRQHVAQYAGAVAAVQCRNPVVIDMQIRRVDDADVPHQFRSKSMRSVTGRP